MTDDARALPKLFGDYVLVAELGAHLGPTGERVRATYLARLKAPKRDLPTVVVLKMLWSDQLDNEEAIERFKHEAGIAVDIECEHLPRIFEVGVLNGVFYFSMEYVAGWPLSEVLELLSERQRFLSVGEIVDLASGFILALDALHSAIDPATIKSLGAIHRDVSPKNLIVAEDGQTHLVDLGLGRSVRKAWATRVGEVVGTLGYMAPEQAAGTAIDLRADIYAAGVILFELATLTAYIPRASLGEMLRATGGPARRPSSKRSDLPPEFDDLVLQALAPDPALRCASANDLIHRLRAIAPAVGRKRLDGLIGELFPNADDLRSTRLIEMTKAVDPRAFANDTETPQLLATRLVPSPNLKKKRGPERSGRLGAAVSLASVAAIASTIVVLRPKHQEQEEKTIAAQSSTIASTPKIRVVPTSNTIDEQGVTDAREQPIQTTTSRSKPKSVARRQPDSRSVPTVLSLIRICESAKRAHPESKEALNRILTELSLVDESSENARADLERLAAEVERVAGNGNE